MATFPRKSALLSLSSSKTVTSSTEWMSFTLLTLEREAEISMSGFISVKRLKHVIVVMKRTNVHSDWCIRLLRLQRHFTACINVALPVLFWKFLHHILILITSCCWSLSCTWNRFHLCPIKLPWCCRYHLVHIPVFLTQQFWWTFLILCIYFLHWLHLFNGTASF